MQLDHEDKEYLSMLFETKMNQSQEPIMKHIAEHELKLERHEQILTGADGNNGLNGDMKSVKKSIERFDRKIAWATGIVGGISLAGQFLKSFILGGK